MNDSVTVSDAIRKGKQFILYPSVLMILLPILFGVYFSVSYNNLNIIYIGIALGLILPFAYKFIVITKWKIWAFENVRNVHLLRKKAYEAGITFSQDNINYFEFRSKIQKKKLEELDRKFLEKDVFNDDLLIPTEMIIHFSIFKAIINIIIWGCVLWFGIYLFNDIKYKFPSTIIIFVSIYFLFIKFKNLANRKPQILMNNKGIQIQNDEFISWFYIKNEEIVVQRNYGKIKMKKKYLSFFVENSEKFVLINFYDISSAKLEYVLQVYRVRYQKNNPI